MPLVARGGSLTLHGRVAHANGNPADDPDLTLTLLDPDGDPVAGFPVAIPPIVRLALGSYEYTWAVPADLATGSYTATWDATVDGAPTSGSESVEVVDEGAIVPPYLTVDELRLFVSSTVDDAALQVLIDAAYDEIEDVAPSTPVNELIRVHGDLLMLAYEVSSIVAIIEDGVTLAADDYEVRSSGRTLRRLVTGTHPAYAWRGTVDVSYVPEADTATRKRVQLALVKLDLAFSPGLASQTIGTWTEAYVAGKPYAEQRSDILASLVDAVMVA